MFARTRAAFWADFGFVSHTLQEEIQCKYKIVQLLILCMTDIVKLSYKILYIACTVVLTPPPLSSDTGMV